MQCKIIILAKFVLFNVLIIPLNPMLPGVKDALAAKHPDLLIPDLDDPNVKCFEHYDELKGIPRLLIGDEVVLRTAKRMRVGAGPMGVDSYLFKTIALR